MSTAFRTTQNLKHYEKRSSNLMLGISIVYIALYAIEVIATGLDATTLNAITIIANVIWVTFGIDLAIRTYLAPNRLKYLAKHPIDVLAVILPAFRAFRVLRVITAGQWVLTRGSHAAIGRTSAAIVVGSILLALVGALAMLDAEGTTADSSITTFGDALWWAFVTMSTVGYGDLYPITTTGRVVAVMMMIVGVSLLGLVSATLASALLVRIRGEEKDDTQELQTRLDSLEAKIDNLTSLLEIEKKSHDSPRE